MTTGLRAARVYQGIAVMDIHHGRQWVWGVDPDRLDVNLPTRCVVGQFDRCTGYEDYDRALECLGIEGERAAINAGFFPEYGEEEVLDRMWAYAIRRLREQRPKEVAA